MHPALATRMGGQREMNRPESSPPLAEKLGKETVPAERSINSNSKRVSSIIKDGMEQGQNSIWKEQAFVGRPVHTKRSGRKVNVNPGLF